MKPSAAVIAAIALHATAQTAAQPPAVFRAGAEAVILDAFVTDGRKPVAGLAKEDFEVRDNGVVQAILDFSVEQRPLDVRIVVDVSGSMTSADRASVERAIAQLSEALDARDRVEVLTFTAHVRARIPPQPPPLSLSLPPAAAGLGSAVFDALLLSLVTPAPAERRELILFMTDGDDTASYFDARIAAETAKHATATATILLVSSRASSSAAAGLRAVAAATGGDLIELKNRNGLSDGFLTALRESRASYTIRYAPAGVTAAGWHDVTVRTKASHHRVRARRGYWAQSGSPR